MDVNSVGTGTYRVGIELQMEPLPVIPAESATPERADAPNEQNQADNTSIHHEDRKLDEMLSKSLDEINKRLSFMSNEMEYRYHRPTRSIAVKIFNSETKEVIREIPPQKALDAIAKMWELAGILVDEKG